MDEFRTMGPRAAVSAWTCLGKRGMKAGSGMSANPVDAAEVSIAGLSLKRKSAPSRAPAASMMADNMRRDVSENSRSAVRAGPRSESASTVCNSRRRLLVCIATDEWATDAPSKMSVTCEEELQGDRVLVNLMRY